VIGRANGLRGAVAFRPHHAESRALDTAKALTLVKDGVVRQVRVASARNASGGWMVTFTGVTDRTQAEALTGAVVFVDPATLPPPAEDEFYYHAIVGAQVVTASGAALGTVADVIQTSTDVLVVDRGPAGELMVPVVPAYVLDLDTTARRVVVVDDAVALLDLSDES
jgi:16S rRNA processing protein RimM